MDLALAGARSAVRPGPAAAAPADIEIAVSGLRKRFGTAPPVLASVSLGVRRGDVVALIGANGAGKSTLLRCLLRLTEPDGGEILVFGERVRDLSPRGLRRLRARIGVVFQKHNLVPRLSVLTNVVHGALGRAGFSALHHGLAPARLRQEALAALDQVGLASLARQRADTLSGGQSQRVAIARALMQAPRAILADEPVASLDPAAGEEVMTLLAGLARAHGLTVLFTTHNMAHAAGFADRVVGLRHGAVALDLEAREAVAPLLERFFE